jgi:preprotein translocase subunit SecG
MNIGVGVGGTVSACLLLILGISFGNWLQKPGGPVRMPPKWSTKSFEWAALLGKGGLIAALIALATINGNVSYVSQNPTKFMQDALATGGFGALAAVFLTLTRGRRDLFFNHLIFAFMLFFLYHVCREFAGYFTIFGSEQKTSKIQKEESKFTKPILVAGAIFAFIAIVLALISRASPDYSQGIFKSLSESMALGLETVIFVAIVTAGEIIVARNHGDPVGPAIGTSAVIFTLAHLVLQAGGFYDHLYKTTHVVANSVENAVKSIKTN